jgi:hypothetical protein
MSESKNDLIKESFNEDFCVRLEHHLTKTFEKSQDKRFKDFWCDGVSMPFVESQLVKKIVNDSKKIETKVWLGKDGQDVYELIINFGPYSLSHYLNGANLLECLPDENSMDWINVDLMKRTIEIYLK